MSPGKDLQALTTTGYCRARWLNRKLLEYTQFTNKCISVGGWPAQPTPFPPSPAAGPRQPFPRPPPSHTRVTRQAISPIYCLSCTPQSHVEPSASSSLEARRHPVALRLWTSGQIPRTSWVVFGAAAFTEKRAEVKSAVHTGSIRSELGPSTQIEVPDPRANKGHIRLSHPWDAKERE